MSISRNYVATEDSVSRIVNDFGVFCTFLKEERPPLTKSQAELGKKALFELNSRLSRPADVDGPKYFQPKYPTINLLFHIALTSRLFVRLGDKRGSAVYAVPSPKLERYEALNPFSKYMFLFRVYWTKLCYTELYSTRTSWTNPYLETKEAFEALKDAQPGKQISAGSGDSFDIYKSDNPIHTFFAHSGQIVHHLADFNFWEYERLFIPDAYRAAYQIFVRSITLTELGVAMIRACLKRPRELYGDEAVIKELIDQGFHMPKFDRRDIKKLSLAQEEPFEKAFTPIFPVGTIKSSELDAILSRSTDSGKKPTAYVFKVSLSRSLWRRIKIAATDTLADLHLAIQRAFRFDDDHLYGFFMDGKRFSNKNAYWDPRCEDEPFADEAVLGEIDLWLGQRFLYLFDFGDQWEFEVLVEEILTEGSPPAKPTIIESKGEAPEQYPVWD